MMGPTADIQGKWGATPPQKCKAREASKTATLGMVKHSLVKPSAAHTFHDNRISML